MRRLSFFSADDVCRIESILKNNFSRWANDYIFADEFLFSLKPMSLSHADISEKDLFFYSDSYMAGVLQEDGFNWSEFVFGSHLAICPRDKSFALIVDRVKKSFFSEVLSFNSGPVKFDNEKKLLKAVNTYFCVEVRGQAFGVMKCIVHQSHFFGLIDGPKRIKSDDNLSSRLSSIASLKVTATVKFDFGIIPFDELIQLHSTRLLSSSNGVKNQFFMSLGDAGLCKVAVGKRADKKAFLILKEQ